MGAQHRLKVGAHSLRLESAGAGSPHFVCLHGLVDTLEIWDPLIASLAARGRVLRFDQRGHGESDAPPGPYRREDLAGDLITILDAAEIDRAVLVGHSMGGIVSMLTALAHPDRIAGMVLIGSASRCSEKVAAWYERIAAAGEREGCAGIARAIYGERTQREVVGDAQGIAHLTRILASLWSDPLTDRLVQVRCPVLLLVGEKDPMGPRASEIMQEKLCDASLEVVPGCGHWLQVEAPDAVTAALDRWLTSSGLAQ